MTCLHFALIVLATIIAAFAWLAFLGWALSGFGSILRSSQ